MKKTKTEINSPIMTIGFFVSISTYMIVDQSVVMILIDKQIVWGENSTLH
jgi:multisubunit Na+/H+ antiporter MnhC subunit